MTTTKLLDETALYSLQSEAAVLGSMLLDSEKIPAVIEILDEKSFFLVDHQTIFDAVKTIYERTGKLDAVLLRGELERRGDLEPALPAYALRWPFHSLLTIS